MTHNFSKVWGLRMDDELESDMSRNSAIITTNATAPLYDRWSEMMTRLQLWVEVNRGGLV